MKYHPHGDASIYSALVVLANKELFIDKQGNFGNLYTGDEASAARYIECRATPFAKDVFYNPKTTVYEDSYDGRNREPVAFPAKLPVVLLTGAEGIAVGMSTKILPHNPVEVIRAEIACLRGKSFRLLPDFPTAGIVDASEYEDGAGKVRVRATLDSSDPKRIVIRDLPYGVTTESLIASVEKAAKSGRLKIASISDFTTDKVEIEVRLARGVYAKETEDALYAFTQCEQSVSCNLLVIKDGQPVLMSVTEIVEYHAKRLLAILKKELELEVKELLDDLHARTLERIFIEERVYKAIENKKTQDGVDKAVIDGLKPFDAEIKREVTLEDVERLLRIPIRRISLYDIEKARAEMERIKAKLKEARHHLAHLTDYGVSFLEGMALRLAPQWQRKTLVSSFGRVDAKEAAKRDVGIRYDRQTGYLGSSVSTGDLLFDASPFDRLLVIRRNGIYSVMDLPERVFVDREMAYCAIADKDALADVVFTAVYKDPRNGSACIKRCRIEAWILNKDYLLVPEGTQLLYFTAEPRRQIVVTYAAKARTRINEERFRVESFDVKGLKAMGVRLSPREAVSVAAAAGAGLFGQSEAGAPRDGSASAPVPKPAGKPAAKSANASAAGRKAGRKPGTAAPAPAGGKAAPAAGKRPVGRPRKAASEAPAASAKPASKTASEPTVKKRTGTASGKAAAKGGKAPSGGLLEKAGKKRKD